MLLTRTPLNTFSPSLLRTQAAQTRHLPLFHLSVTRKPRSLHLAHSTMPVQKLDLGYVFMANPTKDIDELGERLRPLSQHVAEKADPCSRSLALARNRTRELKS